MTTKVQTEEAREDNSEMRAINEMLVISSVRHQELAEVASRAEQRLRDLVHGLDAVICEVGIETRELNFLSLNQDTFLGRTADQWMAGSDFLSEIIHPDDRVRVAGIFPALVENAAPYEYDFRAVSPRKEKIWMRNIVRTVFDSEGNKELLRCVIVDVTRQKQAAEALAAAAVREHEIMEALQLSFLLLPPEDSFPGWAVKGFYKPASDESLVGGDFCDIFACDQGNVAIIIGDVMGHGLPAALFTAEIKYTLRGFVREHGHTGRVMAEMNDCLSESLRLFREGLNSGGDVGLLCLSVAIFHTATGAGTISAAGMNPLLIVRKDGEMETVETKGLMLGITPGETYRESTFHLDHGDLLAIATDGVIEARCGDLFLEYDGLKRLVLAARTEQTLDQMGQSILNEVSTFANGTLKDDACIVLAKRK